MSHNSAYAGPNVDGPVSTSGTGIFGRPGETVEYNINVHGNAGTNVCWDGYSPEEKKFTPIGCGTDNTRGTVEWRNNLAAPAVRCNGTPFGANADWTAR